MNTSHEISLSAHKLILHLQRKYNFSLLPVSPMLLYQPWGDFPCRKWPRGTVFRGHYQDREGKRNLKKSAHSAVTKKLLDETQITANNQKQA